MELPDLNFNPSQKGSCASHCGFLQEADEEDDFPIYIVSTNEFKS